MKRRKKKKKKKKKKEKKVKDTNKKLQKYLKELEERDLQLVQLGDASIASPFTSKSSSVIPITHIIRQGRCTLVTTLQMYRILALNCLVYAYCLSVLNLDGVKLGDLQATVSGFIIAICFFFISTAKPLEKLSPKRPLTKLFNTYLFFTVICQFAVHLSCLIWVIKSSNFYLLKKPDPDANFEANVVNSSAFLIMSSIQIVTFAVNYEGHPFMQSITENKKLFFLPRRMSIISNYHHFSSYSKPKRSL